MTDVIIPVSTAWDVLANALDDGYFWILSGAGSVAIALIVRHRLGRLLRWSSRPSSPRSPRWSDGSASTSASPG